jgi:hypothetical protein
LTSAGELNAKGCGDAILAGFHCAAAGDNTHAS